MGLTRLSNLIMWQFALSNFGLILWHSKKLGTLWLKKRANTQWMKPRKQQTKQICRSHMVSNLKTLYQKTTPIDQVAQKYLKHLLCWGPFQPIKPCESNLGLLVSNFSWLLHAALSMFYLWTPLFSSTWLPTRTRTCHGWPSPRPVAFKTRKLWMIAMKSVGKKLMNIFSTLQKMCQSILRCWPFPISGNRTETSN